VVLIGRSVDKLHGAAQALGAPELVSTIAADVTVEDEVERMFSHVGSLDHLIVTRGGPPPRVPIESTDLSTVPSFIDVMLVSAFSLVKQAQGKLRRGGSVTFTSGISTSLLRKGPSYFAMKAIVAQRYGGSEALALAQRPEPNVRATDVLITVRAASLNPLDYKIRNGNVKLVLPFRPPIGLGCDVLVRGRHSMNPQHGRATTDEIGAARSDRTTTKPTEKGTATMKLTTTTFVSVDGVMQGVGSPDEDRRGGFERGGWTTPLWDTEALAFLNQVYGRADAFLFGRRTYEIFAGSWGTVADPGINPIAAALNSRPKYVASTTLTNPRWANTTVLSSEVAAAVGELRAKSGGELQVHGSGALIRWLLENDLVNEFNFFIFPIVVGQGTRLFPDTGPDKALKLLESRATPSAVTIQVYRPTGRLQVGTSTADLKHVKK
jgi:dihydrofolate reductase